ncbi:MAG: AtpZ/AtpI family protein [Clostridiales bacterium]|nr:AtpZ/AtpI family protein [Clostridiales bacterium]
MPNNKVAIYKWLALLTQIGIMMVVPILAAVYFGGLLDRKLGTNSIFLIVFIIFGVIVAFMNVYKVIMHDINKNNK